MRESQEGKNGPTQKENKQVGVMLISQPPGWRRGGGVLTYMVGGGRPLKLSHQTQKSYFNTPFHTKLLKSIPYFRQTEYLRIIFIGAYCTDITHHFAYFSSVPKYAKLRSSKETSEQILKNLHKPQILCENRTLFWLLKLMYTLFQTRLAPKPY